MPQVAATSSDFSCPCSSSMVLSQQHWREDAIAMLGKHHATALHLCVSMHPFCMKA